MKLRLAAAAALGFMALTSPAQGAGETLQPYQILRSLQHVQDRIADGDHAALPMQNKLIETLDARLRNAPLSDFEDPRNLRTLMIYAMSGGNPVTVEAMLSRLTLNDADRALGKGISEYLRGRIGDATKSLQPIDPMAMPPDIGAFVALVKGSIDARENPAAARILLDQARLLAPGTLVEETALRRSIPVVADLGDADGLLDASGRYVRRFLRSPYAGQFADALVAGIVKLNAPLDYKEIEAAVAQMGVEHRKAIYLRLARVSAIEGLENLAAFASRKAEEFGSGATGDARAALYSILSSVTSGAPTEVLRKLNAIKADALSERDVRLLSAARAVASGVAAPFSGGDIRPASAAAPAALSAAESPVAKEPGAVAVDSVEDALPKPAAAVDDPAGEFLVETRKKLQDIDKLLGEAGK